MTTEYQRGIARGLEMAAVAMDEREAETIYLAGASTHIRAIPISDGAEPTIKTPIGMGFDPYIPGEDAAEPEPVVGTRQVRIPVWQNIAGAWLTNASNEADYFPEYQSVVDWHRIYILADIPIPQDTVVPGRVG